MRSLESVMGAMVRAAVVSAFAVWLAMWMVHAGYASW